LPNEARRFKKMRSVLGAAEARAWASTYLFSPAVLFRGVTQRGN